MYFFVMNIRITVPDKGEKVETDTLETEDPTNLHMCNQKTKVFGPIMPPQLEKKPETTSHVEVKKLQCGDEEKGREGKKKRNERRIQQRNKKVLYGSIVLFLLMEYIRCSLSHSTPVKYYQLLLLLHDLYIPLKCSYLVRLHSITL
jgi:hypothetical protein